jgi:hypothetical protein
LQQLLITADSKHFVGQRERYQMAASATITHWRGIVRKMDANFIPRLVQSWKNAD